MARLLGPDMGSRMVILPSGTPAAAKVGTVYSNAAGTILADILTYQPGNPTVPGAPLAGSQVTTDGFGLLPLFWWPDGVDIVWITVNGGPLVQINADYDARLDAVESGKQPLDSDLTAIAVLTPPDDDVIQRKAGVWTNRTMAQLKTDLALSPAPAAGIFAQKLAVLGPYDAGTGALTINPGVLVLVRVYVPVAMTLTTLGVWMRGAGITSTGVNGLACYDAAGNLLAQTVDMTAAFSTANAYGEAALTGSINLAANTSVYLAYLSHFTTTPTLTGKDVGTNLVPINGTRASVLLTAQATFPASVNLATASLNSGAYSLYGR